MTTGDRKRNNEKEKTQRTKKQKKLHEAAGRGAVKTNVKKEKKYQNDEMQKENMKTVEKGKARQKMKCCKGEREKKTAKKQDKTKQIQGGGGGQGKE